jgi:SAM-dependent methyltransferase
VPHERVAEALPVTDCLTDGWLVPEGDEVRASVDVRPYGGPEGQDWWIVSDLGCAVGGAGGIGGPGGARGAVDRSRLVLGVGGASTTLAGLTIRTPVKRALDLGTGSGIQALHASRHAARVTATDPNPRALDMARLTLALSGAPEPDLREGSLFEPVGGETYDLIVSNPPFVISPRSAEDDRLVYRDGGMAGDDLCRTLVQQAGGHLSDGGWCQLLANWQHVQGEDWRERLASWVPPGCDAWIVQREVQDVAQYAELWLRDAGEHLAGTRGVRGALRRLAGRVRGARDHGRRLRLDHAAQVRCRPAVGDRGGVAASGRAAAGGGRGGPLRPAGLPARAR